MESEKLNNEHDIIEQIKKYVPITLISEDERKEYVNSKNKTWTNIVKQISHKHPDFGSKISKIYYDLYIKD